MKQRLSFKSNAATESAAGVAAPGADAPAKDQPGLPLVPQTAHMAEIQILDSGKSSFLIFLACDLTASLNAFMQWAVFPLDRAEDATSQPGCRVPVRTSRWHRIQRSVRDSCYLRKTPCQALSCVTDTPVSRKFTSFKHGASAEAGQLNCRRAMLQSPDNLKS